MANYTLEIVRDPFYRYISVLRFQVGSDKTLVLGRDILFRALQLSLK